MEQSGFEMLVTPPIEGRLAGPIHNFQQFLLIAIGVKIGLVWKRSTWLSIQFLQSLSILNLFASWTWLASWRKDYQFYHAHDTRLWIYIIALSFYYTTKLTIENKSDARKIVQWNSANTASYTYTHILTTEIKFELRCGIEKMADSLVITLPHKKSIYKAYIVCVCVRVIKD